MTTVVIPSQLRDLTGGTHQVELEGRRVRDLVRALEGRFPGFAERLGERFSVAIDGEIVGDPMLTAVEPNSEVHFLPVMSGG